MKFLKNRNIILVVAFAFLLAACVKETSYEKGANVYGKSLGTGIAAQLASVRDCKKLILETPYYSMDALAKHYFFIFPVVPMTKYSIPTHQYFEYISAPISIFHGTNDRVIPYKHAKRLTSQKNGTELITIVKGRHNNLSDFPLFHEKLDSLLQQ